MNRQLSQTIRVCSLGVGMLACSMQAYSGVFFGADEFDSTANTFAAYSDWKTTVSSFASETLDGLVITGSRESASTSLGSRLTTIDSNLFSLDTSIHNDEGGVLSGTFIRVESIGTVAMYGFEWELPSPANAVGLFGVDNDGGMLNVSLVNGNVETFSFDAAPGGSDRLFWGVSGLASDIKAMTVMTTDPGGSTRWDNLVFGSSMGVPVPTVPMLMVAGVLAYGAFGRRRVT